MRISNKLSSKPTIVRHTTTIGSISLPPIFQCPFNKLNVPNISRHSVRSRILNLKDKNNPLLRISIITQDITPKEFARMTSEEMASPQRRQENIRLRRSSLTETVGINEMRPYSPPDGEAPWEPGQDEMARSGHPGVEYQRPV